MASAAALAFALSPSLRSLAVVLAVSAPSATLGDLDLVGLERRLGAAEEQLARFAEVSPVPVTGLALVGRPVELVERALELSPDVIVFGEPAEKTGALALEVARTHRVATLCPGTSATARVARLVHPFSGDGESLASSGAFLRDRTVEGDRVAVLPLGPLDARLAGDPKDLATVAGVRAEVSVLSWTELQLGDDDVVLLSSDAGNLAEDLAMHVALRALARGPRPLLFSPALVRRPVREGALDAFDAVPRRDALVVRVERQPAFGGPTPESGPIHLVAQGLALGELVLREGVLSLPRVLEREGSLGLGRPAPEGDALTAMETTTAVSPWEGPVALVDARLTELPPLLSLADHLLVFVRTAEQPSARDLRKALRAAGLLRARVIDVRDVLDEGAATDVPVEVSAVRLARAATRLRADGIAVDVVVSDDGSLTRASPAAAATTLQERLDALTASTIVAGNQVLVELDNGAARRALIALIDRARERLHAQWYIVEDDEITREVEAALVRAGARGVAVRVLCDSLYSLHGSLGAKNALLERLSRAPGVQVLASRPIAHVPSVEELRQRDHRKLVVADGVSAIVSGRNLGQTYYRGFSEARIDAASTHRDVPWLDAGVSIDGPAVRALDASFLEAFVEAGGEPFTLLEPAPVGPTDVRVVVHRGLRDAHTLEAYRTLIEGARERLLVVNSFPMHTELQHALLDALGRGVRVSMLVGRARPSYGDDQPFAGAPYHGIADVLVRARLSTLVAAGADVRELVLSGFDAALGPVRPHVHAKLLCADDRLLAVGSANLDVTAGYWESELLLLVSDPDVVGPVVAQLRAHLGAGSPLDPADPKWVEGEPLRSFVGRVWPTVLA